MSNKLPTHITRLLLLLGFFLILAFAAKILLTDPSFYRFGHYRADSVTQLAAGTPVYRGANFCVSCHDDGFAFGSGGAHGQVQCELCHGTDSQHPDSPEILVPSDTIELCATCHEAMPARPASHPQIVLAEHPSPGGEAQQCHTCHDPHLPGGVAPEAGALDSETSGAVAAAPPSKLLETVTKCAKCHGQRGEGRKRNPAIAGLEPGLFIDLMNQYRSGAREDKRMAVYARNLSDQEIGELARYYKRLAPGPTE